MRRRSPLSLYSASTLAPWPGNRLALAQRIAARPFFPLPLPPIMRFPFLHLVSAGVFLALTVAAGEAPRPKLSEYEVLRAFPPGRLAALSSGDYPDKHGLTGSNRANGSWLEAGPQRGSCRGVIAAVAAGNLAAADDAWRGIEVAFAHQRADGGFEAELRPNGTSAKPHGAAVETAFFFLQELGRAILGSGSPRTKSTFTTASSRWSRRSAAPATLFPRATTQLSPTAAAP